MVLVVFSWGAEQTIQYDDHMTLLKTWPSFLDANPPQTSDSCDSPNLQTTILNMLEWHWKTLPRLLQIITKVPNMLQEPTPTSFRLSRACVLSHLSTRNSSVNRPKKHAAGWAGPKTCLKIVVVFFLLHLSAYGQLVVWVSILLCCYSTAPGYTTSKPPPSNVQEQYSTIVARTLQHAIIPPVTGNSGHKQSQKTVFSHASSIISNLCNFQIDHEPQWSWLENYKNRIKGKRASSHLLQCTLLKYQKLQWFHLHWQTAHEHLLYRKEKSVSISIFHCTWTILKTHNIPNDFCLPINQSEHSLVNLHFLFFRCFLSTAISCENHHLWCMAWSCGAWRSEQKKVPAWFMPFCKFTPCQTHYPILWFTV